jgi:hypothetical protein
LAVLLRSPGGRNARADRKGGGGRRGWIWLGSAQLGGAQGKGDGFGLAERATTLAGGIERGRPERVEQPGMVTGAQSFVDGVEGLSSLLVLVIGGAVQSGGDDGVAAGVGG